MERNVSRVVGERIYRVVGGCESVAGNLYQIVVREWVASPQKRCCSWLRTAGLRGQV